MDQYNTDKDGVKFDGAILKITRRKKLNRCMTHAVMKHMLLLLLLLLEGEADAAAAAVARGRSCINHRAEAAAAARGRGCINHHAELLESPTAAIA